jgi:hypothetical protein
VVEVERLEAQPRNCFPSSCLDWTEDVLSDLEPPLEGLSDPRSSRQSVRAVHATSHMLGRFGVETSAHSAGANMFHQCWHRSLADSDGSMPAAAALDG